MSRHAHSEQHPTDLRDMFTARFWDERYAGSDRVWSGRPNAGLVDEVADLPVGTALDVGCGEGADAVWLAGRGWRVTGVDVSQVALDRAAGHAAEAGLADRTSWQQVDVYAGEPLPGSFDLVSAGFVHVPLEAFDAVYTRLIDAVAPGGRLVVVAHHPVDAALGLRNEDLSRLLFTPEQITRLLDGTWEVETAEARPREQGRDGETLTVTDTVVRAARRPV